MTKQQHNTKFNIDDIIILEDSIDIYILYLDIKESIYNTRKDIKELVKELNYNIGGPQDVKAQQYDKIQSGGIASDINDVYKQIELINQSINNLKAELERLIKSKKQLENIFDEISKVKPNDVKLKVFMGYHIKGRTLNQLSKEIYRVDEFGRKKRYSYQYLRRINAEFTKNTKKDD